LLTNSTFLYQYLKFSFILLDVAFARNFYVIVSTPQFDCFVKHYPCNFSYFKL